MRGVTYGAIFGVRIPQLVTQLPLALSPGLLLVLGLQCFAPVHIPHASCLRRARPSPGLACVAASISAIRSWRLCPPLLKLLQMLWLRLVIELLLHAIVIRMRWVPISVNLCRRTTSPARGVRPPPWRHGEPCRAGPLMS